MSNNESESSHRFDHQVQTDYFTNIMAHPYQSKCPEDGIYMFSVPLHVLYSTKLHVKECYLDMLRAKKCHQNRINNALYSFKQEQQRFCKAYDTYNKNPQQHSGSCNFSRCTAIESSVTTDYLGDENPISHSHPQLIHSSTVAST